MKKAAVHIPSSVMNLRNQKLKKERKRELLVFGFFYDFVIFTNLQVLYYFSIEPTNPLISDTKNRNSRIWKTYLLQTSELQICLFAQTYFIHLMWNENIFTVVCFWTNN